LPRAPGGGNPVTAEHTSVSVKTDIAEQNAKGFDRCASPADYACIAAFAFRVTARARWVWAS